MMNSLIFIISEKKPKFYGENMIFSLSIYEGNTSDSCRQRNYPVGYYEILGYGIPDY